MITTARNSLTIGQRFSAVERSVLEMVRERMPALTRCSLGVVYLWFGILKFLPGLSPAEALAGKTLQMLSFGAIPPSVGVPVLAVWESLIGVLLLCNARPRLVGWMMVFHLLGTFSPLVLFPTVAFSGFGVPTLVGQYIAKNIVLMVAALTILLRSQETTRSL